MTLPYPTLMGSVRKCRPCCMSSPSQGTSSFSGAEEATSLNVCGSTATDFANPRQKTHEITFDPREVTYPWHRWFGLTIATRKAGGPHSERAYLCKLPESPPHTMLVEVPKWMFDAAECAQMRLEAFPYVDCETLRSLERTLMEQRASLRSTVIQPLPTGHAGSGDTDGSDPRSKMEKAVGAVRRTTRRSALERSVSTDTSRSSKPAGAVAHQHADRQSRLRPARKRGA